ncbi:MULTISPECIES: hypothetical protein [Lysinibacillus]|uniref:GNAT family N-acetyltransferase n=1 Tax=Lysinibacillus antri TaxID=2498145 RepID=A0A432L9G0_9BACI|nr:MULTISPECIES: hypothetical protein [Lysinibacillus]RUL50343.1 hypothetical protein EK386_14290 [Lysinibacillus antri]TSI08305.1 hypothetical protein FJQ64_07340 [Lysinibacillus sp. BW-2-10]
MRLLKCQQEEEYERFVYFLLQNRNMFDEAFGVSYSLFDAIGSLYLILGQENVLLILDEQEEMIGFACYTYGTRENQFEDQHIAFVNCAVLKPNYRRSRAFLYYFKQLTKLMKEEKDDIKEFRFYAYRHHNYTQRLYRKFATVIGEIEDQFAIKDIFSVEFSQLCEYLEQFDKKIRV